MKKTTGMKKRILAIALSLLMVNSLIDYTVPMQVNAEADSGNETVTELELPVDSEEEAETEPDVSVDSEGEAEAEPDTPDETVEELPAGPEEDAAEEDTEPKDDSMEDQPEDSTVEQEEESQPEDSTVEQEEESQSEDSTVEQEEESQPEDSTVEQTEPTEQSAPSEEENLAEEFMTDAAALESVSIEEADSDVLDVSTLETRSISFGAGYSDYIVIDSDNVDDFNGKTLTGTTTSGISISDYVEVNLTIENLNITKSQNISSCISVGYGAILNLTVKGENTLKATGWGGAGIEVMGQKKATLRITADSTGILNASGGYGSSLHGSYGGAGIGGVARITSDINRVYVGNIIIEGGTINAKGGYQAAGIGGTIGESGGTITITGGTVNATGGSYAAGIGGGSLGNVESITIKDGTVTATAGQGGAAIGAGYCGASSTDHVFGFGNIEITGGNVTANGNIGYGTFRNENHISGGSGTVKISDNLYINVTGEIKTGNSDNVISTMKKYTINFTVYDRKFTANTEAKVQLGNDTLTDSAEAVLAYKGKLTIPVSFTTGILTGEKSFTVTIDGREYTTVISFEEDKTSYEASIGAELFAYTVQFAVYDGRFTQDTTATVKHDGEVVADSVEAKFVHGGRLDVSAEFPEESLTDNQPFTLTVDGRDYTTEIPFEEGTTKYDATVGTPLYPVTLEFYDTAISGNLQVSAVTVKQKDKTLSAENGEFYAPAAIQCVRYGYGTMLAYLPADSGSSTEISVTASALNGGKVMTKSDQTISEDSENRILMLDTGELLLSATVSKSYGNHVVVRIESNLEDVTVYYKQSDTEITDGSEIISDNSGTTLSGKSGEITISDLKEVKSYDYYLIAAKEGRENTSNIVKLTVTTVYEVEVTGADGTVKKYASAEEVLNSAPAGSTVTLLSDALVLGQIKFPNSYTLDLHGCTLESRYSETSTAFYNSGHTITIMDSVGGGVMRGPKSTTLLMNRYKGTLTITGGTFESKSGWTALMMVSGKLCITNGRFKNTVNIYDLSTSESPRPEISGGVFEAGFRENSSCWSSGSSLASGYVYRYLSGENAGKVTGGNVGENSVEVVPAPDLKGSLTLSSVSSPVAADSELTATFESGDTSEWADADSIGSYTYTWYRVGENEDTILLTDYSAQMTNTYTILPDDIGKEIYCVVTAEGCSGSVASKTIKVPAMSLADAKVTLSNTSLIYDGTVKEPTVTVTLDGSWLKEGTDYRLFYSDNKNAGMATVKAEGINKYEGTVSATFTIEKKAVTVSGITAEKIYDGRTEAVLDYSNVVFGGKVDGDTLTVTATGTFDDANAGENKTVTISGLTLGGASAGNYVLEDSGQQTEAFGIIKPRAVSLVWSKNTDFTYDGKEHGVTATVSNAVGSDSITLTYKNSGMTTNEATGVGSYTAEVTDLDNKNYTLEGADNVTQAWSISYLKAADAAISGTAGENDWYTSAVTLTPPDGHTISTDQSSWKDTLTIDTEGTQMVEYYLKDANGNMTDKKSAEIKIDTVAPTGEIRIKDNVFNQLLNAITFGHFFKETVNVNITGADATSDIETIEYQKVAGTDAYDADSTWTPGSSFNVSPNEKFVVYARITDGAGHRSIINSEGVVVYTDVAASSSMTFAKKSAEDVDAGLTLNGNTVNSILIHTDTTDETTGTGADSTLDKGAYKVEGDRLILNASYLDTLDPGIYTLTVSYNPLGEIYTGGSSTGEAPQTTAITLTVKKAVPVITTVPAASDITYGQTLSDSVLSGGAADTEGSFAWEDSSVQPTYVADSGKTEYVVIFTPDDTENYESAFCKITVTVHQAENAPNIPENAITADHKTETVGAVPLTEGWVWNSDDFGKTLKVGETLTAEAVYDGNDKGNYKNETVQISITRPDHTIVVDPESYVPPTEEQDGSVIYRCTECDKTISVVIPAVTILVPEATASLTEVDLPSGWTWETKAELQPGTIVTATAVYKVTDDIVITNTIQIKVPCSVTNGSYQLGTDKTVTIRCTGVLSAFHGLAVDGKTLTKGQEYTAVSGSTIITFSADYLNTLSVGKHTVVMSYDSGNAEAEIQISKAAISDSGKTDTGKTDTGNTDAGNTGTGNTDTDKTNIGNGSKHKKTESSNVSEKVTPEETTSSNDVTSPATGDTNNVLLWFLVLAASAGLLLAVLKKRKKIK